MGAGCAGLSLVGVLAAVGIVLWLGASAFDGTGGGSRLASHGTPASTPTTIPPSEVMVSVHPADGLTDGATVQVESDGFPPGASVQVSTCVNAGAVTGNAAACDQGTTQRATVDSNGLFQLSHRVVRVVSAGALPLDCASEPGRCRIEVRATGAGPGGTELVGSAPLSFVPGGSVEIPLPD